MKIECVKENLQKAVGIAERATGKKLPLAILGNIILEARDKNLFIKATNLDLGVEVKIASKITGAGLIAVSGTVLESHLSNLPPRSNITIENTNGNLIISTNSSTTLITSVSTEDFPELPKLENKKDNSIHKFSIDIKHLTEGLRSVLYAASPSDLKPELSAVCMQQSNSDLTFAATDSFRLAEKRVPLVKNEIKDEVPNILIPIRNAIEINRSLAENEGVVEVIFNKNQISFSTNNIYITSRLVEGSFPSYKELIPKSFETQAVLLKDEFVSALKMAAVFSDRFHQIKIKIIPDENILEMHTRHQEAGETTVKVDATLEGSHLDISLNGRYMIEAIQSLLKDSITLGFNGPNKAALLRSVGDKSFNYLVMPLHQ